MTAEDLIREILRKNRKISKIEILEQLEKERKSTGGLISDETLLRVIGRRQGIDISQKQGVIHEPSLGDLIPGLNNVTVAGRVLAVFTPIFSNGKGKWKLASFLIADKHSVLRVVLWNDKIELVQSGIVKSGQIVRISHGYTREDRSGKAELQVGEKGIVEINPQDIIAKDFPTVSKFAVKIGKLVHEHKAGKVNLIGTVKKVFPASNFERQDASCGRVMRFILADGTGEIMIVAWNERVDELENVLKDDLELQIVNAKVKKGMKDNLEVHVDSTTSVEPFMSEELLRISDLKAGQTKVSVEGLVVTAPSLRDVKTSKGEVVKVAVFELKDQTSRIWVSAWRRHALVSGDLKKGDRITIRHANVKRGFSDQLEISTTGATNITVVS